PDARRKRGRPLPCRRVQGGPPTGTARSGSEEDLSRSSVKVTLLRLYRFRQRLAAPRASECLSGGQFRENLSLPSLAVNLARQAGARRLVPFHFSPKYAEEGDRLAQEAQAAFEGS